MKVEKAKTSSLVTATSNLHAKDNNKSGDFLHTHENFHLRSHNGREMRNKIVRSCSMHTWEQVHICTRHL